MDVMKTIRTMMLTSPTQFSTCLGHRKAERSGEFWIETSVSFFENDLGMGQKKTLYPDEHHFLAAK
jgi:hypothetical protein